MTKKYEKPRIELENFESSDVITTSDGLDAQSIDKSVPFKYDAY
jgi:hypothetical protein